MISLKMLLNPEPWMGQARCREVDPDLWFPDKGESDKSQRAKEICGRCPVQRQCLQYALDNTECWGVWGGLSYDDRKDLKRKLRSELAS